MYVCVYVCKYLHIDTDMSINNVHIVVYACVYIRNLLCMYRCAWAHVCMEVCVCMYARMHVCYIPLRSFALRHVKLRYVTLVPDMFCHVVLWCFMLCCVVLCYVMLCYVM